MLLFVLAAKIVWASTATILLSLWLGMLTSELAEFTSARQDILGQTLFICGIIIFADFVWERAMRSLFGDTVVGYNSCHFRC
jgi:hypothetical protein